MSNMGHVISDIQEMYHQGKTSQEICKLTKTSSEFVEDVIKNLQIDEAWEEYNPNFPS